jgi:hypothetical protein
MKIPEFTREDFEMAMLYVSTRPNTVPKKIKVTHNFYNYLAAKFTVDVIHEKDNPPRGYYTNFTGIPVEIDDTIENEYYELVYEENSDDQRRNA